MSKLGKHHYIAETLMGGFLGFSFSMLLQLLILFLFSFLVPAPLESVQYEYHWYYFLHLAAEIVLGLLLKILGVLFYVANIVCCLLGAALGLVGTELEWRVWAFRQKSLRLAMIERRREAEELEIYFPPGQCDPVSETIEPVLPVGDGGLLRLGETPVEVPSAPSPSTSSASSEASRPKKQSRKKEKGKGKKGKRGSSGSGTDTGGSKTAVVISPPTQAGALAPTNLPPAPWKREQIRWASTPQKVRVTKFVAWIARQIRAVKGGPMFEFDAGNNAAVRRLARSMMEERHVRKAHIAQMMDAIVALVFTPSETERVCIERMEAQKVCSMGLIRQLGWFVRSQWEEFTGEHRDLTRRMKRLVTRDF
jgi:hypothetical protein